jgi:structural maintenance of chromosome 1
LTDIQAELKVVKKTVSTLTAKVTSTTSDLAKIESQMASYQTVIDAAEDLIFASFCKRIKVKSIREYESTQLKSAQEGNEERLKFDTHMRKLSHRYVPSHSSRCQLD